MTDDELKSMSDLVTETDEARRISEQLHEFLVHEVKHMRASAPDLFEGGEGPLQRLG